MRNGQQNTKDSCVNRGNNRVTLWWPSEKHRAELEVSDVHPRRIPFL